MNIVAMGLGSPTEIAIIAVVVLVLFGGAKIANFGKSAGEGIRSFKDEVRKAGEDDPGGQPDGIGDAKS